MDPAVRIALIVMICCGFIQTLPVEDSEVKGEVIPDFDLDVNDGLVIVNPDTNIGLFEIVVTNQCADSLGIRIQISAAGYLASPGIQSINVGPYSSETVPGAIAALSSKPERTARAIVYASVTHVNGAPFDGVKERDSSALVILPRNHDINPGFLNVTVGKGEAKETTIWMNNTGNSVNYFAIEFFNGDEVQAYPVVDYIRVEAGTEFYYPIIVTVSDNAPTSLHYIDYRIYSLADAGGGEEATVTVNVIEDRTMGSSGLGELSMVGALVGVGMIFLILLVLFGSGSGVGNRWAIADRKRRRTPQGVLSVLLVILLVICAIPNGSAVNGIVVDGNVDLDVSPATADNGCFGMVTVTLLNNEAFEQVARVTTEADVVSLGFNRYQRIPANGEKEFNLHVYAPKGTFAHHNVISINAQAVERGGVEWDDGNSHSAPLLIRVDPFSLPYLEPLTSVTIEAEEGKRTVLDFKGTNSGNRDDSMNITVESVSRTSGFTLGVSPETGEIEQNGSLQYGVSIKQKNELKDDFAIMKVFYHGCSEDGPVAGSTIIYYQKNDEISKETYMMFSAVVAAVIILAVLYVKRK